jgi:hypothetical protein
MKIDNDIKLLIALILTIDVFLVALCYIANSISVIKSIVFLFGLEAIVLAVFLLFAKLIDYYLRD